MRYLQFYLKYLLLGFLLGLLLTGQPLLAQELLHPASVPKFVNKLPIPSVIDAIDAGGREITMTISQFEQDLGLGLKDASGTPVLTNVWGYNGQYPGPTILTKKDQPIQVKWLNRLVDEGGEPLPHLLPVDKSIHWANPKGPGVPIVTHLHGGHTESESDGLPGAWYTPYAREKGPYFVKGEQIPYHYDNDQTAATLWYHDHTLGLTRLNVYAGLAGFYLLTDGFENGLRKSKRLPDPKYDIGLAIQDRMFTADGQLFYPTEPEEGGAHAMSDSHGVPDPSILPEFFGDIILVNGKAWPILNVEPRQYRFRVLNGSDSRFYNLKLTKGVKVWQIGSDQGFLTTPVEHSELLISPGERMDVVVDFSGANLWGETIIMTNDANTPFPDGDPVNAGDSQTQIMAFKVDVPLNRAYPLTHLPASFHKPLPPTPTATQVRKLILFEGEDAYGRLKPMLGTVKDGALEFTDPITENPDLNSTEIWEIYNLTPDSHPVHLHLVFFKVLSSQKFTGDVDEEGRLTNIQLMGVPETPEPGQDGKKDTYPIAPGEVTRLVATFDREGRYVWHCHILSHEDHEMMRPYYVANMPDHMLASQNHALEGVVNINPGNEVFSVYPNPFSDAATLRLSVDEPTEVTVRLFDLSGRLVRHVPAQRLPVGHHQLEINSAAIQTGMYVFEVAVNNKLYRSKVVLAR
ncbi:multicopper oxidase domain-containing protein [Pontibacter roseus]|uniref:multicopper oxidase domain-containing protein n=1 Tax=Pontibacter roseus TaxID=336989 RepID=UPI0003643B1E|nr:multicopper oxidase domain-containing protein [Pontibacter roseus]